MSYGYNTNFKRIIEGEWSQPGQFLRGKQGYICEFNMVGETIEEARKLAVDFHQKRSEYHAHHAECAANAQL